MSAQSTAAALSDAPRRMPALAACALIALATLGAYHNCFRGPFVYDDLFAIPDNPTIRHLWSAPWELFSPPADTTVGGRPVANLTLAINYALGGTDVWSYHALNLLIHVLAALTLFGVVRRTLEGPVLARRFGMDSVPLSLASALLWSVHPLQTECVTYVVQRVESLMGLFYLLTVYCFIRSASSPRSARWQACAVAACLLGMATKEVMATAPVMVLLFDRTFFAGTFRNAWRQRRGMYIALSATWLPLAWLVAGTGWSRKGSAGFNAAVSPVDYWISQFEAVARYARLAAWPRPLVFEYGPFRVRGPGQMIPSAIAVAALAAATLVALRRWPAAGFLGAWFLVILAPSSMVPVAAQTMAEHRMYLPLASAAVAAALGSYALAGRRSWPVLGLVALLLGFLTARRNEVYSSELTLWADTVAGRPDNANARNNLGLALFRAGRIPEAIEQYRTAIGIEPAYPGALNNLGNALDRSGRTQEAIGCYEAALRLEPGFAAAHYNLAKALERTGRTQEAVGQFQAALAIKPDNARAHFELGNALVEAGRMAEAIDNYEGALRIQPELAEASNNLGVLLCRSGRVAEGLERIDAAIRAQPGFAQAHFSRGMALLQMGQRDGAVAEFERVLELRPDDPPARRMLELIGSPR